MSVKHILITLARRLRRQTCGDTLVESVAGVALFALLAVFLVSAMLLAGTLIGRARGKTKNSMSAAAGIAQGTTGSTAGNVSSSAGTMTFTDSAGATYTVSGAYLSGNADSGGEGNDVEYYTFQPGS